MFCASLLHSLFCCDLLSSSDFDGNSFYSGTCVAIDVVEGDERVQTRGRCDVDQGIPFGPFERIVNRLRDIGVARRKHAQYEVATGAAFHASNGFVSLFRLEERAWICGTGTFGDNAQRSLGSTSRENSCCNEEPNKGAVLHDITSRVVVVAALSAAKVGAELAIVLHSFQSPRRLALEQINSRAVRECHRRRRAVRASDRRQVVD